MVDDAGDGLVGGEACFEVGRDELEELVVGLVRLAWEVLGFDARDEGVVDW